MLRVCSPVYPLIMIGSGIAHFQDVCAVNLPGFLIGDGFLLLSICIWGFGFEIAIRILQWDKSSFVFCPLVLVLGLLHASLYVHSFSLYKESQPAVDFTWILTSWDERHAGEPGSPREKIEVQWGVPTPSPTAAGTFDGVGCQTELLDMFYRFQVVSGVIAGVWIITLWRMLKYMSKYADDEDGCDDELVEQVKQGRVALPKQDVVSPGLDVKQGVDADKTGSGLRRPIDDGNVGVGVDVVDIESGQ